MQRRVEELDVALSRTLRCLGVDLGRVGREQPLSHADADVARQRGVAVAAEVALVAGDVDARILRVGLQQLLEPRIRRRRLALSASARLRAVPRPAQARSARASRRRTGEIRADGFIVAIIIRRPPPDPVFRGFPCQIPPRRSPARPAAPLARAALGWQELGLEPASADASFRRYFRVAHDGETVIAMDAPPDKEDVEPYLRVAGMLEAIGVNAPRVLARNAADGFLLLTDLGATTYLAELGDAGAGRGRSMRDAIAALVRIQARGGEHARSLPPYDERLLRRDAPVSGLAAGAAPVGLELSPAESRGAGGGVRSLAANALAQPQVFVHRDYHSRNLMVLPRAQPGHPRFPGCGARRAHLRPRVVAARLLRGVAAGAGRGWARDFRSQALAAGLPAGSDEAQFLRWFDLMGMQRHLKASGIFARLWHRDGKPGYLPDVPRARSATSSRPAERHGEFAALGGWCASASLPAMQASLEAAGA